VKNRPVVGGPARGLDEQQNLGDSSQGTKILKPNNACREPGSIVRTSFSGHQSQSDLLQLSQLIAPLRPSADLPAASIAPQSRFGCALPCLVIRLLATIPSPAHTFALLPPLSAALNFIPFIVCAA
jgi:hypothetical protein